MEPQSDTVQGVGKELLSDAKDVGSSAVNRLHSEVDARKGGAANQVKSVSSAIEKAGDGLDANAPTWLKSAFEQGDSGTPVKADSGVLKRYYELAGSGGADRAARVHAVAKRLSRATAL